MWRVQTWTKGTYSRGFHVGLLAVPSVVFSGDSSSGYQQGASGRRLTLKVTLGQVCDN